MGFTATARPGLFGAAVPGPALAAEAVAVAAGTDVVVVDVAEAAGAFRQDAAAAMSRSSQSACFIKAQC